MSKLKTLIINSKGGVGKSTVAMQLLAPYIFNKTNQVVKLFELDDENDDAKAFGATAIMESSKRKVSGDLRDLMREIALADENFIIDVGANKTSTEILNALIESGMIYVIDLCVIPLMDGEQDAINAFNAYITIRDCAKTPKILFVLNRCNTTRDLHTQFDIFLGDKRGFFDDMGLINSIKAEDQNYVTLADSDVIKYARKFGLSIFELARLDRDLDYDLKQAIEQGKDVKHIKYLSFKKALQTDAMRYHTDVLLKAFEKIDSLLKGA